MKRWLKPLSLSVCFILLLSPPLAHAQSPVPNDTYLNAIEVTTPFEYRQDISLATFGGGDDYPYAPCHYSVKAPVHATVWYRYTPTLGGILQLHATITGYGTETVVYTLSSRGFSHVTCSLYEYPMKVPVIPGNTYLIMIAATGYFPTQRPVPMLVFTGDFVQKPSVNQLVLVNADTNTMIATIPPYRVYGQPAYTIDLTYGTHPNYNILAVTTDDTASVGFIVNGRLWYSIESSPPFLLAGDYAGDYLPWQYSLDTYRVSAIPYRQINASGKPGTSIWVEIRFVYNPQFTKFVLINADTDQDILRIDDGDVIDLSELPTQNLNIRAEFESSANIGSVRFSLNGDDNFRVENDIPFTLGGDNHGDYKPIHLSPGSYWLHAMPYMLRYAQGWAGWWSDVRFTVVE